MSHTRFDYQKEDMTTLFAYNTPVESIELVSSFRTPGMSPSHLG